MTKLERIVAITKRTGMMATEKLGLVVLTLHADEAGRVRMTQSDLARQIGVELRTGYTVTKELRRRKIIERIPDPLSRVATYQICGW